METTYQKIIRRTGRKPVSCKCHACKSQCTTCCCLGTPGDILRIIDAGFADRIRDTAWWAGVVLKVHDSPINMYQPNFDEGKSACTFFTNGLCELHDLGLKPTEGKLSHHTFKTDNFNAKKSVTWNVAKEWLNPDHADIISKIVEKLT